MFFCLSIGREKIMLNGSEIDVKISVLWSDMWSRVKNRACSILKIGKNKPEIYDKNAPFVGF